MRYQHPAKFPPRFCPAFALPRESQVSGSMGGAGIVDGRGIVLPLHGLEGPAWEPLRAPSAALPATLRGRG